MRANNYTPALIKIYTKEGWIATEQSLVAVEKDKQKVIAWGNEAEKYMDDKEILVINPFKQGVIEDFILARVFMTNFIRKYGKKQMFKRQKIVFSLLTEYSEIQKKALTETVYMTGGVGEVKISDDRSVFDESDMLKQFFEKNDCDLLIDITQENPCRYVRERAEELIAYAAKYGVEMDITIK